MWVLKGPFDGEERVLSFQVEKLVEAGKKYTLGRKDAALIINHKKISKEHCDFVVGQGTDVSNPKLRPTIQVVNKRDKPISVNRRGEELPVNPLSAFDLEHEDDVVVANNAIVTVSWIPVCCYLAPSKSKPDIPLDECARLGIHVVCTLDAEITHHLTPQFITNRASAVSLVSASRFARPGWLAELIRTGTITQGKSISALEASFSLPSATKFRPEWSPSVEKPFRSFNLWEPNEARVNMFQGRRFLFVVDAGQVDPDLRRVVTKGRGEYATFIAGSGTAAFAKQLGKVLSQVDSDVNRMIVVANIAAVKTAIGDAAWKELEREVSGIGLRVRTEDDIIQSVLRADIESLLDDASQTSSLSSLPSVMPNSIADESTLTQSKRTGTRGKAPFQESEEISQPSRTSIKRRAPSKAPEESKSTLSLSPEPEEPPKKKLVRRAPSRQATPPEKRETIEIDDSPPPPPRKPLRRRAGRGTTPVIGIDDPSTVLEAEPLITPTLESKEMPPPTQPLIDLTAPTHTRPSRLKRRAQTQQPSEDTTSSIEPVIAISEPALKKYKALFDASHPDSQKPPALEPILELLDGDDSQTQSQTQSGPSAGGGKGGVLSAREEEESQTQSQAALRGKKRARAVDEEGDIEMIEDAESQRPPAKRRALEKDENVPPPSQAAKKPSSSAQTFKAADRPGEPGSVDKDEAFLKAISKKRGKKKDEEILDREFNNLRIAKPDLEEENEDDQRRILEEFGDEGDVRGNFMVVLEMDVPLRRRERLDDRSNADRAGLPNFKKFKKKTTPGEHKRRGLDLVVSEPSDFGTGPAYWQSQSQRENRRNEDQDFQSPIKHTTQQNKSPTKRTFVVDSDSDDDNEATPEIPPKSPVKKRQNDSKGKKPVTNTLFLEGSEDEVQEEVQPKVAAKPSRATSKRSTAKKAAIIVEDSDDETAFKGFGRRKR